MDSLLNVLTYGGYDEVGSAILGGMVLILILFLILLFIIGITAIVLDRKSVV